MIGKGDYVLAQFTYGKGAMNYVASDLGGGGMGKTVTSRMAPVSPRT